MIEEMKVLLNKLIAIQELLKDYPDRAIRSQQHPSIGALVWIEKYIYTAQDNLYECIEYLKKLTE